MYFIKHEHRTTIITEQVHRDALHIAIAPVIATEKLSPGQHVGFVYPGDCEHVGKSDSPIGVISPYLTKPILKDQKVWLLLYPQTITSLRHEWVHPAFTNAVEESDKRAKAESEVWLREFAEELEISYNTLLDAAHNYLKTEQSYCLNNDTPDIVYERRGELWEHYEIVTGVKVVDRDATFFRCAC